MVVFNSDGSCDIKQDVSSAQISWFLIVTAAVISVFMALNRYIDRAGFTAHLTPALDPHIDPVRALHTYIARTQPIRHIHTCPACISLCRPYKVLSADTIPSILVEAISLADLHGHSFSAVTM